MDQRYRKSRLPNDPTYPIIKKNPIQEKVFVLCVGWVQGKESHTNTFKLRSEMNQTKVSHKILLMKSSRDHFISFPVLYLIMSKLTLETSSEMMHFQA